MDSISVIYILAGSTLGLIIRFLIKYNLRTKAVFYLDKTFIVNILSSFFLGITIAFSLTNKNLLLFFSVGFLGCLSTFSSFIYQLYILIKKRKYLRFLIYYLEVLVLSFLFFILGYFITLILKN